MSNQVIYEIYSFESNQWVECDKYEFDNTDEKNRRILSPFVSLSLSELKNLLCNVSQLIQGWNATEAEWTEWDKEVQSKVHELQNKIDGLSVVNFH